MLTEVNITNPTHKIFHSSIAGSLRDESQKKKPNKKPERLKNIKHVVYSDKHKQETESSPDKDRELTPKYKKRELERKNSQHYYERGEENNKAKEAYRQTRLRNIESKVTIEI